MVNANGDVLITRYSLADTIPIWRVMDPLHNGMISSVSYPLHIPCISVVITMVYTTTRGINIGIITRDVIRARDLMG